MTRAQDLFNAPPVPAHALAWRGTPLTIELQQTGTTRQRISSHSNEYVGHLRARLAQQMGCSPQCVRLFLLGEHCGVARAGVVAAGAAAGPAVPTRRQELRAGSIGSQWGGLVLAPAAAHNQLALHTHIHTHTSICARTSPSMACTLTCPCPGCLQARSCARMRSP